MWGPDPRNGSSLQTREKARHRFSPGRPEGTSPADSLALIAKTHCRRLTSGDGRRCLAASFVETCYRSSTKLIHVNMLLNPVE